jgi:cytosine/adenosine deaminase-related metal-dependent hydrolase
VTLHVAESPQDRLQCGVSSVEYLAGIGFLGPEVLAAHCVYVDSNDIRRLKAFDVKVAHNPVSNMFLGNGIAPIAEMVTAGITVGLGTDNTDLNSSVNLIADMRLAALGQKARYQDPTALTAEQVLEMATIGGARAIGLEHEIGSLEVGKKADLFLLDIRRSTMVPFRSPVSEPLGDTA